MIMNPLRLSVARTRKHGGQAMMNLREYDRTEFLDSGHIFGHFQDGVLYLGLFLALLTAFMVLDLGDKC